MRTCQIATGAVFLVYGAALMIGRNKYVRWSCKTKSRFLPKCYEGTLKEFAEAGPSVYLYWGATNVLAGGVILLSAFTDGCRKKDAGDRRTDH